MAFQPLPSADIMASVEVVYDEPDQVPSKMEASQKPHPTFESHPNTQVADIDVKKEVECLPFRLNFEDIHLDKNIRPNLSISFMVTGKYSHYMMWTWVTAID